MSYMQVVNRNREKMEKELQAVREENERLRAGLDAIASEPVSDWDSAVTLRKIIRGMKADAVAALNRPAAVQEQKP